MAEAIYHPEQIFVGSVIKVKYNVFVYKTPNEAYSADKLPIKEEFAYGIIKAVYAQSIVVQYICSKGEIIEEIPLKY